MPLTVCPLSNVKLCAVSSMQAHPIKKLMDAGDLKKLSANSIRASWLHEVQKARHLAVIDRL